VLEGTTSWADWRATTGRMRQAIEKLPARSGRIVANLCQQAWCPRWQAQDDPGSPSVRAIPFLRARRPILDRRSRPDSRISWELRAWTLTGGQRCHHELR
jgi:hypothetical protein